MKAHTFPKVSTATLTTCGKRKKKAVTFKGWSVLSTESGKRNTRLLSDDLPIRLPIAHGSSVITAVSGCLEMTWNVLSYFLRKVLKQIWMIESLLMSPRAVSVLQNSTGNVGDKNVFNILRRKNKQKSPNENSNIYSLARQGLLCDTTKPNGLKTDCYA